VTNVVDFDDLFTDALIFKIAANLAVSIKRDNNLAINLMQIADQKTQAARTHDSQEGTFNVMRNNVLLNVRGGIQSPSNTPVSGVGTARND
jgi:hypothetical protein